MARATLTDPCCHIEDADSVVLEDTQPRSNARDGRPNQIISAVSRDESCRIIDSDNVEP